MNTTRIALHEAEFIKLRSILHRTQSALRAELVMLIERGGQQLVTEGPARDIDLTALSSLAAANLAATDGLARVVGEPEFSVLYHQGKHRNIHISSVLNRFCLVLVFDETVSLGLVRLRVRHATAYLEQLFRLFERGAEANGTERAAFDFTDDEIDRMFGF